MKLEFSVAGTSFRSRDDLASVAKVVRSGPHRLVSAMLRREPTNKFDPNAIRVYCNDAWLGYVPRVQAATLAPCMDRGDRIDAVVTRVLVDPDDDYDPIKFDLRVVATDARAGR